MKGLTTKQIDTLVEALCIVESNNNPIAVGDDGHAVGILQMWVIQVNECNRIMKKKVWDHMDRLDPVKSKDMCVIFLRYWTNLRGITNTVQAGGLWRNPNGKAPGWYLDKVRKALEVVNDKQRTG